MATCPAGHTSESTDYCDICGMPMDGPAAGGASKDADATPEGPKTVGVACPNCGVMNAPGALFCEACGYDYTTGTMPQRPDPLSVLDLDAPLPDPGTTAPAPAPSAPETAGSTRGIDLSGWSRARQGVPKAPSPSPKPPADAAPEVDTPADPAPDIDTPAPAVPPVAPSAARTAPPRSEPATAQNESAAAPDSAGSGTITSPPASPSAAEGGKDTFEWVVEIWIDPEWYSMQQSPDTMPSPGLPDIVPLRGRSALIGRLSRSRNIHPDIDCEPDSGISRRQAELTTDGTRWFIEDLDSANGTYVAQAAGRLPNDPIPSGRRRELDGDERIYMGAWTRLVLRRATPEEQEAYAAV